MMHANTKAHAKIAVLGKSCEKVGAPGIAATKQEAMLVREPQRHAWLAALGSVCCGWMIVVAVCSSTAHASSAGNGARGRQYHHPYACVKVELRPMPRLTSRSWLCRVAARWRQL